MSRHLDHGAGTPVGRGFIWLAALVGLLIAGAPSGATATVPPADTPDLSVMNVAVGDLRRGAAVEHQAYVREPGVVAAYERSFAFSGRAMRRSGLVYVDGELSLFGAAPDASGTFSMVHQARRNPQSRTSIAHISSRELGVRANNVHVGKARDLHVAARAMALPVTVVKKQLGLTALLAVMARDRVLGQLTVVSTSRPRRALRRIRKLLAAMSDHIGAGLSPHSTSPPLITGPAQVGAVLQANPGTWSDTTKPTTIGYQWQRCNPARAACAAMPGATKPAYTVAATDRGATLRVTVTATNAAGATTATSAQQR